MIQTIEQSTRTRILIGQNGIIVVTGRDSDGIKLAVKAIRLVEEEAHTANLTQRVKSLLGVTDPSRQEPSSIPKPQNVQKNDELQSSIQEVEEELEEEVEEGEKT